MLLVGACTARHRLFYATPHLCGAQATARSTPIVTSCAGFLAVVHGGLKPVTVDLAIQVTPVIDA